MKNLFWGSARAGALLAIFALGSGYSAQAGADDAAKQAGIVEASPAQQQPVRFPLVKVGGVRSGNVMLITDSGTQSVRASELAQRQISRPALSSELCISR